MLRRETQSGIAHQEVIHRAFAINYVSTITQRAHHLPTPMPHVPLSLLPLRDHVFGYAMEDCPERQIVGGFESAR